MADLKLTSVKKNGFHDLWSPWENNSFGKREMSEARPFWAMHNGPFLRQNWRLKSNNFQLRPNTSVFSREASHFQLQGISAFGNFVIPDPHYFVILFQASILWKPAISWFWRIIYIFWFLRKFFQILNLSSAYFFALSYLFFASRSTYFH